MFIRSLSLTNFRALKRLDMDIPDQLTLFYGENAQGKTSLLEAIHFISLLTSPIATHDREILNLSNLDDESPFCRLVACIEKKDKSQKIDIRLFKNQNQNSNQRLIKEVFVDGVKRRLYDVVGFFNSVLFLPQMTRIIEDGPDERRRYLDQLISQVNPHYMRALTEYHHGLARRNALLKLLQEKRGDHEQLTFYDQLLSDKGALIIHQRYLAVSEMQLLFARLHSDITESREVIRLEYHPAFPSVFCEKMVDNPNGAWLLPSPDQLRDDLLEGLRELRLEEIRRGITTIGPHRDDLTFFANDVDLRVYGSRGQIRTAVLSLKLAETQWMEKKTGELPVLLLDETLAELDQIRREKLLKSISNGWQAIITTADLRLFSNEFINRCAVWKVHEGRLVTYPILS